MCLYTFFLVLIIFKFFKLIYFITRRILNGTVMLGQVEGCWVKGCLIKVQGNLARVMILLRQCKIPLNLSGSEGVRTKKEWLPERRGDLCGQGWLERSCSYQGHSQGWRLHRERIWVLKGSPPALPPSLLPDLLWELPIGWTRSEVRGHGILLMSIPGSFLRQRARKRRDFLFVSLFFLTVAEWQESNMENERMFFSLSLLILYL